MGEYYFTDEQVKDLEANPYVKRVNHKAITYEESFKEIFMEKYENGSLPSQIFMECGFNTKALGSERIGSFSKSVRKQFKRIDGFKDTRKDNSGRPRTKNLSKDEQIEQLKHEITFLNRRVIF